MSTLPPSLVRFEHQLENAIRRRRGRPRRLALRAAFAAAAACAIALGVLSALPANGPSVVERAAAALSPPSGTILHVVLQSEGLEIESWQQSAPPYARRESTLSGGQRFEVAEVNGVPQLYDAQTNTIYTGAPRKQIPSKPMAKEGPVQRPDIGDDPYRGKILALLESGKAHEDGRTTVAGREAIRIVADDGAMTLLVDADTYEPIEWRVDQGARTTTARFTTYEHLEATEATAALLSLTAQHPDATVDADPEHFEAAMQRQFLTDVNKGGEK